MERFKEMVQNDFKNQEIQMKIALIGYGKMGKMIEKIALERGHEIVARINSSSWNETELQPAEICIEFTHPEALMPNIKKIAKLKKDVVIGTTGWYDQLDTVNSMVQEAQIGALYSPNFSIGVNLLISILGHAGKLMKKFDEYDVAGIEVHHNQKKDHPSGTALEIAKVLDLNLERPDKVSFASVRCGSIPGTHTVIFDSPCDTISITHSARNREGFARGAVQAAEWVHGKKGLYSFDQCMHSIIQGR